MTEETIDYAAVLEDLRAKRNRLDAAIRGIEEMLNVTPQESPLARRTVPPVAETVTEDTFLGMSKPQAAVKYLQMVKRPQTTAQVARALRQGGIESSSANFNNTVYTALHRAEGVIRLGKKWALKEHHPSARPVRKKPNGTASDGNVDDGENGNGDDVDLKDLGL